MQASSGLQGRVDAADIHRMSYNALLYSNRSSALKGVVLWIQGGNQLRVVSTDEFVVITDQAEVIGAPGVMWWQTDQAQMRLLEKELRDYPSAIYDLADLPGQRAEPDGDDIVDMLKHGDDVIWVCDTLPDSSSRVFGMHPDRLRKLALLKPGDYPIDLKFFQQGDQMMVGFRAGPTVRGVVAALDRGTQEKLYAGEELWR